MPMPENEVQEYEDLTTIPSEEEGAEDLAEGGDEGDLEEEAGAEGAEEELHEISLKGQYGEDRQVKVSLEDLKKGFMMHDDYTRKTMDLAKTRDSLDLQLHEARTKHRTEYVNTLESLRGLMISTIEPEIASVNWQTLAKEDPEEYMRLQARVSQHNALLSKISDEQYRRVEEQAQQDHAMRAKMIEESVARLSLEIPGWNDSLYGEILTTIAGKYGFTPQEVASIIDPRLVKAMHDLTKFHAIGAAKKTGPSQGAKQVVRAVPSSASPGPVSRRSNVAAAVDRARKSGSVHDAALALTLRQKSSRR